MREQIFGQIDQHRVAREPDDGLVEFDVDVGIFVEMGVQLAVIEGGEQAAQTGDLVVAGDSA